MAKHNIKNLDDGQLDMMWNFLRFRQEPLTKEDVRELKQSLDAIRQAMIQMTGGRGKEGPEEYVPFEDVGTYVNLIVVQTMTLYLCGGLDILENALPEEEEK